MRRYIGYVSVTALFIAVVGGVFFPTLGADASVRENLLAWVGYTLLFIGGCWGLIREHY